MKKYIITGPKAVLFAGNLELDYAQSAPRAANLRKLDNGFFEILREVQFKRGEVIGYDGAIDKVLAELMEPEAPLEVKAETEVIEVKQAKKHKETII